MRTLTKDHFRFGILLLVLLTVLSACDENCGCEGQCTQKVFKRTGAIQCEYPGIPLEEMAQELIDAGIPIICSQKGSDGLFYITLCGAPSGAINIYEIHSKNLGKAIELGFAPVDNLPEYQDRPCENDAP